jgi:hypothetical protein
MHCLPIIMANVYDDSDAVRLIYWGVMVSHTSLLKFVSFFLFFTYFYLFSIYIVFFSSFYYKVFFFPMKNMFYFGLFRRVYMLMSK